MEHKKDLAKIALAALILASAAPVNAEVDNSTEVAGIFLAAGCPAHGCPATTKNPIADNASGKRDTSNSSNDYYQPDSSNVSQNSGASSSSKTSASPSSRSSGTLSWDSKTRTPSGGYRNDPTSGDNDYSTRSDKGSKGQNRTTIAADEGKADANTSASAYLTEAQLLSMVSPKVKEIYLTLDPEGKGMAIYLARQDSYQDKSLAIKEAQKLMNERRASR